MSWQRIYSTIYTFTVGWNRRAKIFLGTSSRFIAESGNEVSPNLESAIDVRSKMAYCSNTYIVEE